MKRITRETIELLAPAGNWESLRAAVANGADAVFFGVEKFNARVRAKNFQMDELPDIMAYLHKYNVRGYVTLNILIFENELEDAKMLVNACMDAGVDALIVQDIGLATLIREMSPDFPIHGSTQMTITSPEAIEFLKDIDLEIVVLGRENNMKQIKTIASKTDMPLEVFVHGALCVSYSGQCLTSEMWGGRSANRGECAQACRLPYDLIVDGERKEMGNLAYVLSPKDLAAIDLVPQLIEAGVSSFKIEGRLKSPEYVSNVVSKYRKAIDEYINGQDYTPSHEEMRELQQSFSRGFTHGFLDGTNHKKLLDGTFPKSRGVYLGEVKKILSDRVVVHIQEPLKRGDGLVFDHGKPEEKEEGGRVYDLYKDGKKVEGEITRGTYEIVMGRNAVNLKRVYVGDRVWKTSDQELERRLQKTFETELAFRTFPVSVKVEGKVDEVLHSTWTDVQTGNQIEIDSEALLQVAMKRPLTKEYLEQQWSRLGDTVFHLEEVVLELEGEVIVPVKELNAMRRRAAEGLLEKRMTPYPYTKNEVDLNRKTIEAGEIKAEPKLHVLCRTLEQVEAACETDATDIYADFEFPTQFPEAVAYCRSHNKSIYLTTPRIHMPGENGIINMILRAKPDGIIVRNMGGLQFITSQNVDIPLIGDYSLNISNSKTSDVFLSKGLERFTPSYDLNTQQMMDLLEHADSSKAEVVIHQHLPMFHTEHCVYCTFLSEGTDFTNCGRPCEKSRISLEDRVGFKHPVRVDVGCRNTVYNAIEQSGAEYIPAFKELGISHFRIEFLEETKDEVKKVVSLYKEALEGKRTGTSVWKTLKATNQLGVTRGQLVKENFKEKKLGQKA